MVEFPVKVDYTPRQHGAERSVNVLYEDSDREFVATQEWRLKAISISGDLREELDINKLQESMVIGVVDVDPDTLEWEFTPSEEFEDVAEISSQ
jgi:hypothetical protein